MSPRYCLQVYPDQQLVSVDIICIRIQVDRPGYMCPGTSVCNCVAAAPCDYFVFLSGVLTYLFIYLFTGPTLNLLVQYRYGRVLDVHHATALFVHLSRSSTPLTGM